MTLVSLCHSSEGACGLMKSSTNTINSTGYKDASKTKCDLFMTISSFSQATTNDAFAKDYMDPVVTSLSYLEGPFTWYVHVRTNFQISVNHPPIYTHKL